MKRMKPAAINTRHRREEAKGRGRPRLDSLDTHGVCTVKEAAVHLGLQPPRVYQLIAEGELEAADDDDLRTTGIRPGLVRKSDSHPG